MIGKPNWLIVEQAEPTTEYTQYPGIYKDIETGLYFWVDEVWLL